MKRNLVQALAAILLVAANTAQAQNAFGNIQAEMQSNQDLRLMRITALLHELQKMKAIETEEDGKIVVKQSLRELLESKQLLKSTARAPGSLCD